MGERMLPETHPEIHCVHLRNEVVRIWKASKVPNERTGVCLSLPAGLHAEDIAWYVVVAKRLGKIENIIGAGIKFPTIGNSQTPKWRHGPTAREEVVPLN